MSDGFKSRWDNPAYGSRQARGRNYFLKVSMPQTAAAAEQSTATIAEEKDVPLCAAAVLSPPAVNHRFTLVNGEISEIRGPPVLLVTDLDGTLIGHDAYLRKFNEVWLKRHVWRGSKLIYSTGRNLKDFLCASALLDLLQPDYAICGVGTEIYSFSQEATPTNSIQQMLKFNPNVAALKALDALDPLVQDAELKCPSWCPSRSHAHFDPTWLKVMAAEFDRVVAEERARALQGELYINGNIYHDPWRLSVLVRTKEIAALADDGDDTDVDENLEVDTTPRDAYTDGFKALMRHFDGYKLLISGQGDWRYLDLLPKSGGKLMPLQYLMKRLNFLPDYTIVCGDSGNDVDMFAAPGVKGVCVGNSQEELLEFLEGNSGLARERGLRPIAEVCFATLPCAGGILEALQFFHFDQGIL